MRTVLTVISDFADYQKGAEITDPKKVKEILDSAQHANVVKTEREDEKKADPK